jgi:hypothetical protein
MGPIVGGLPSLIGLGLLFALARWPAFVVSALQDRDLVGPGSVLFANALLALVTIAIVWTPHVRLGPLTALVVIGAAAICGEDFLWHHVFLDSSEWWRARPLVYCLPGRSGWRTWWIVYCLCFAGTLLYLRALGYGLGRTVRGAKPLANDAASQ